MPPIAARPEGFVCGYEGRVYVGATELAIVSWSGDHDFGREDRTHSKTRGSSRVSRGIETFSNLQIECEVPRDPATGKAECPPVVGGKTYPLQCMSEDGIGYAFDGYIQTVSPRNQITGKMGYSLKGESNGDITPWDGEALPTPANVPVAAPPVVVDDAQVVEPTAVVEAAPL